MNATDSGGTDADGNISLEDGTSGYSVISAPTKTELAGGALLDVGVYGLFLSLFLAKSLGLSFKPELLKVNSHFCKEDKVDLSNDILLRFGENLNVNLFSSISHNLTREAYIGGTKGFIKIEDFIAPTKMQLNLYKDINFDINGYDLETKDYDFQLQGSALQYNVIHISDCFSKGLTESPIMSHSMSLELIEYWINFQLSCPFLLALVLLMYLLGSQLHF